MATPGGTQGHGSSGSQQHATAGTDYNPAQAIIDTAMKYLGVPYQYGGNGFKGIDCSGLVKAAYAAAGIQLPRVSFQQANGGQRISIKDAKPGDMIAWDDGNRNPGADHIAIYLGHNKILEAPHTGTDVRIRTLGSWSADNSAWAVRYSKVNGPGMAEASVNSDPFPIAQNLINSNPDLKRVYNDWKAAGPGGWTDAKLQSELQATAWWQNSTPEQRQEALAAATPGDNAAFQSGLTNTKLSTSDQLKQYAAQMGVSFNDSWFNNQAAGVASGTLSIEAAHEHIKQMALSTFPTLADQIEAGHTVEDLASPYTNAMSNLLEIPSSSIKLSDPTIMKALVGTDPATGKPTQQPIWAFQNQLRQDPRWLKTDNSRSEGFAVLQHVGQDMGFL